MLYCALPEEFFWVWAWNLNRECLAAITTASRMFEDPIDVDAFKVGHFLVLRELLGQIINPISECIWEG
jgi:hypothetical protein